MSGEWGAGRLILLRGSFVRSLAAVLILCAAVATGRARAEWPLFRGGADATGASAGALPSQPDLLWTYPVGESGFEATAVISGGVVYVGDYDGTVHAVGLACGKAVWTKTFENVGFLSPAAVDDGRLYVGDDCGGVRCLDISDGEVLWTFEAGSEIYSGVNLHEGKVLLATESGRFHSLDAATGKPLWEPFQIDSPLRCWPVVVGGRVLLAGCDSVLHAVDVGTGEETGSIAIEGPTGATPAIVGGRAFFGTYDGVFYSMRTDPLERAWRYDDPPELREIVGSAACDGEVVVFGSRSRAVYGLDAKSGQRLWFRATRGRVESSPVLAGDSAWFATMRGRLEAVNKRTGEKQWSFDAGGSFKASPAISEGRLVIGNTDGALYCFGQKQEEPLPSGS